MADVDVNLRVNADPAEKSVAAFAKSAEANIQKVEVSFASLKAVATGTLAFLAARGVTGFLEGAIEEAKQGQSALEELNNSLRSSGQFTDQASKGFQDFASQLQRTTKFSDDAVIRAGALIQTISRIGGESLPRASKAAADLASAYKLDLDTAAKLVGKALEGNVGALGRYGIAAKKGATSAQTLANVLGAIEARVGGRAQADANTYAGQIAILGNQFNEIRKAIGAFIIEGEGTKSVLIAVNDAVELLGQGVQGTIVFLKANSAAIGQLVQFLVSLGAALGVIATVRAFGSAIAFLTSTATAAATSINGLKLAIAGLKAVGTFGLAIAIDLAIEKFQTLKAEFGSFGNIAKAVGLEIQATFLDALSSIFEKVAKIRELLQRLGVQKVNPAAIAELNTQAAQFAVSAANARKEIDKLKIPAEVNRSAASVQTNFKAIAETASTIPEALKRVQDALRNVGLSQTAIIEREKQERINAVRDALKARVVSEGVANELLRKINLDAAQKIEEERTKIFKAGLAERDALTKKFADAAQLFLAPLASLAQPQRQKASNDAAIDAEKTLRETRIASIQKTTKEQEKAIKSLFDNGAITDAARDSQLETLKAREEAEIAFITKESELKQEALRVEADRRQQQLDQELKARQAGTQFLAAGLSAIADSFLPGIGGAVSSLVTLLAQGPEAVRASFAQLIEGVKLAILAIVDAVGPLIDAIIDAAPKFVAALVEKIPDLITVLAQKMPEVSVGLTNALITQTPRIIEAFVAGMVNNAPKIGEAIFLAVRDSLLTLPRLFLDLLKGIPVLGDAIKAAGLAEGGKIPTGFPGDSFPAGLTSGELVVPRGTVNDLEAFLASQGQGSADVSAVRQDIAALGQAVAQSGEKNLTVNLRIGEKELAAVLLQINRQGFRTA